MEIPPLYEKTIECPCCEATFKISKVRTKSIKIEKNDSDFYPIYEINTVHAFYYNVYVCEHCGYSFTEDFSKYFAPGTKEQLISQISSKWVKRSYNGERSNYQAIEAYKLGLLCGTLKKEKAVYLAGLSLRIAWIYRSLQNEAQEMRFITYARNQYMESYNIEDYAGTQMTDVQVLYMIAELSRRIQDFENSTRYFSKVLETQRDGVRGKIIEMAKNQWELVREMREREREQQNL